MVVLLRLFLRCLFVDNIVGVVVAVIVVDFVDDDVVVVFVV